MSVRDVLARDAVTEALRLRARHGYRPEQPVCPFDLAKAEGVDVRFEPLKSLDGLYTPDGPLIVLGSLRPRGRRGYTCAHELGHHVFGHGVRFDELLDDAPVDPKDDAEYVADRFAAALLMPKLAVLRAFSVRGWQINDTTPQQIYAIAGLLGVGYATLIGYLEVTLRLLPSSAARVLRKRAPKSIRREILGADSPDELIIVDERWEGRSVDVEVGDIVIAPEGCSVEGDAVEHLENGSFRARRPGIAPMKRGPWSVDLRIARAAFTGLAVYRHLEEAEDDDC